MASIQKRSISLLLVLLLVFGMFPIVSAAEIANTPTTEPAEEATSGEVFSSPLIPMDDGILPIAESEIVGAPNVFCNVFLLNGGIDIPAFDHIQHKDHLPLYSVYLKNQPGYENNYYVAYCIEPGVELGGTGNHSGSSTTVGGIADGTGALEKLSREQIEAMGIILMYGQRDIARRADDESARLEKLARHAATQVLIWEIASGWRSAVPPYTRYDSTFYEAIVPELECAVRVWGTKFYLDGIDDAYNEIVAQMQQHYTIPSFMAGSDTTSSCYVLIADENGKRSITLTDTNNILSQYSFANTSDLTFSVSGNNLTITANRPIPDTLVVPTKQVPDLDSQVFYVWENEDQQKLMSCKAEPSCDPMPAYFYVAAPELAASLELTKTTEDKNNLSGWIFGIYSDSGCSNLISGPHTTDAGGKFSITDLTAGTVYVKELGHMDSTITALYSCNGDNPQKVVLTAGNTTSVCFHNNLQTGHGRIVKQTNTGENLGGYKINLYSDAALTQLVNGAPFIFPDSGVIDIHLPAGDYWCQEIDESDQRPYWTFDTEVKKLTIVADKTTEVAFTNNLRPGSITIVKQNLNSEHLAGAKFLLEWSEDGSLWWPIQYSDSGKVVKGYCSNPDVVEGALTTSESGIIEWGNLHPGLYYRIVELEAPEGYILLSEAAYEGKLPEDDVDVVLRVINCEAFTLPQTGSSAALFFYISQLLCAAVCSTMLILSFRKKRRK